MKTRINLAGVQYSDYNKLEEKSILSEIKKPSGKLQLFHDKKNAYDKEALMVKLVGVKIGYIPKGPIKDSMWKAKRAGRKPKIALVGYHKTNPTWSMLTLEIDIPIVLDVDSEWDEEDTLTHDYYGQD